MPPAASPPPIIVADGLAGLIDRYDAVLCDLWGAVHDGVRPYPGAVDCLRRLRASRRQVLFLSNAPRPHTSVAEQLRTIGVPDDCYDDIVTSGDATAAALNRRERAAYYAIGPARDRSLLDLLADRPAPFERADYLLVTGLVDDERETVEDYRGLLEAAVRRNMSMVCANPDVVVVRGGRTVLCAGALAAFYESLGGVVERYGKPYPGIFDTAVERLDGGARSRVVMLGDGLPTDIKGAAGAGIDSIWIAGGIHREEVGLGPNGLLDAMRVREICARLSLCPVAVVPSLVW